MSKNSKLVLSDAYDLYASMRNSGTSRDEAKKEISEIFRKELDVLFVKYNIDDNNSVKNSMVTRYVNGINREFENIYRKKKEMADREISGLYWPTRKIFLKMYEQNASRNAIIDELTKIYTQAVNKILNKYGLLNSNLNFNDFRTVITKFVEMWEESGYTF